MSGTPVRLYSLSFLVLCSRCLWDVKGKRTEHFRPPLKGGLFISNQRRFTMFDTLLVWAFAALLLVVPQYIETLF